MTTDFWSLSMTMGRVEGIPPKQSLDGVPMFLPIHWHEQARKNAQKRAKNGAKVSIWDR
jgi:hypothetical protein